MRTGTSRIDNHRENRTDLMDPGKSFHTIVVIDTYNMFSSSIMSHKLDTITAVRSFATFISVSLVTVTIVVTLHLWYWDFKIRAYMERLNGCFEHHKTLQP